MCYVINLGRQLGSGGKEIGEKLARALGVAFYDKELIRLASEESGLCREVFEQADERASRPLTECLFGSRFSYAGGGGAALGGYLTNDKLFQIQSDVIRSLAGRQSCLFVGRCADYILRDHPRRVDLFVCAAPRARAERLRARLGISAEAAAELMEKADKKRAAYYNYYSNKTWGAAASYDLCVDSSALGIDGTADFLREFVARKLSLPR